jgi:hypothetical protein
MTLNDLTHSYKDYRDTDIAIMNDNGELSFLDATASHWIQDDEDGEKVLVLEV